MLYLTNVITCKGNAIHDLIDIGIDLGHCNKSHINEKDNYETICTNFLQI